MKKTTSIALAFAILAATSPVIMAQGSLTPPGGVPGPVMKTLDQIEARTPISSLPYTINSAGSYYLSGNLLFSASSGDAITITADNVTLDLNGFTLSSTPAVTGRAISVGSSLNNIVIKNGNIAGNTTVTTSGSSHNNRTWSVTAAGFEAGVYGTSTVYRACLVDRINVSGARGSGILVTYCGVMNCLATSNGIHGISVISGSVANSSAMLNGSNGISALSGNVTNSTSTYNGGLGISALSGSVANCTTLFSGQAGIDSFSVTNSTAVANRSNGISASGGSVSNSSASTNGGTGIYVGDGSVTGSVARSNGSNGIEAPNGSVTGSVARSNNTLGLVGLFDLSATNAVVAMTKYGTGDTTGSTLTGNKTP